MSAFATRQKVDASALNRTSELYNKILTLARNALIVAMDEAGEATGTTSSKYSTLQLCFVRPVPITERIGKFRVHMLPLSPLYIRHLSAYAYQEGVSFVLADPIHRNA